MTADPGFVHLHVHSAYSLLEGALPIGRIAKLADKLGFHDAFMGEHLTDACETITNSMMFHASLIPATTRIKLATGTSNLSHMHPVLIAVQAAMFDHLAEGRFILGVSPGALTATWTRTGGDRESP